MDLRYHRVVSSLIYRYTDIDIQIYNTDIDQIYRYISDLYQYYISLIYIRYI